VNSFHGCTVSCALQLQRPSIDVPVPQPGLGLCNLSRLPSACCPSAVWCRRGCSPGGAMRHPRQHREAGVWPREGGSPQRRWCCCHLLCELSSWLRVRSDLSGERLESCFGCSLDTVGIKCRFSGLNPHLSLHHSSWSPIRHLFGKSVALLLQYMVGPSGLTPDMVQESKALNFLMSGSILPDLCFTVPFLKNCLSLWT
jgi:hypothetical protein